MQPITQVGANFDWTLDNSPITSADWRVLSGEDNDCIDENHGIHWQKKSGDQGGPFYRWKTAITRVPSEFHTLYRPNGLGSNRGKLYEGRLTIAPEPVPPFQDAEQLANDNGASLWNKAKPAKPLMQGAAAIFELRELPEMLRQRFLTPRSGIGIQNAKHGKEVLANISNYWLALKFGWEPLLKDVRNFVTTQLNGQKYLEQLIRDEGKPVRRKSAMPTQFTDYGVSEFEGYQYFEQGFVTQAYHTVPKGTFHWTSGADCWFEGQFRYWLPPGPRDVNWTNRMLAAIFGLYPTPSQVYQVMPWSWLIDWFTNVGDVVDNASGGVEDKLSADYAYCMAHKWYMREAKSVGEFYSSNSFDGPTVSLTASSQMYTDTKVRIVPSPFGFGFDGDFSLSLTQWSILGALGLSSSRPVRR
jgi:hypothetical protein